MDERGHWTVDDPLFYDAMDVHGTLPWSVLRADSKTWQRRKKWWLYHGVDDITPRVGSGHMPADKPGKPISGGVSTFDPHLAEVLLTWFCPPGGAALDPFAGGPVRGLVAGHLGYTYTGVDLLGPQVEANRVRLADWEAAGLVQVPPVWVHAAAQEYLTGVAADSADFVLTCPPYHNRERYSTDPRDLSAMSWDEFVAALRAVVEQALRLLRPDRFATWVVGDLRDKRGHLRCLPGTLTQIMRDAGAPLVNEQVLVTSAGTLGIAMRPPWEAARTTTRRHQMVLTYVKGDRRVAAQAVQARQDRGADTAGGGAGC